MKQYIDIKEYWYAWFYDRKIDTVNPFLVAFKMFGYDKAIVITSDDYGRDGYTLLFKKGKLKGILYEKDIPSVRIIDQVTRDGRLNRWLSDGDGSSTLFKKAIRPIPSPHSPTHQ